MSTEPIVAAPGAEGTVAGTEGRRTIADTFSGRHNSLNFVRLILATLVLIDHAVGLGGVVLSTFNETSIGTVAVYGFFGISGFLIAGSAVRNHPGRYLWQRFLRIFPGLWVCLIVTAVLFGVIAYLHNPYPHCGLSCYVHAPDGPFPYVYRNALLPNGYLSQFSIAGTPRGVLFSGVWDGSLWTLFYEFLCYLILLGLALTGFLKRRVLTLVAACIVWTSIFVITLHRHYDLQFSLGHNNLIMNLLKFAAIFLAGAVIYLYRDVIPDSGWLALACGVGYLFSMYLPNGSVLGQMRNPIYNFTASDLFAPLIAYPVLWLGIHLPFQKLGARNDYSYGVYIYSYPASQLLVIFGLQRLGMAPFVILCAVATAPLAVGSWWLVERHALRLKRARFPWSGRVEPDGSDGAPENEVPAAFGNAPEPLVGS